MSDPFGANNWFDFGGPGRPIIKSMGPNQPGSRDPRTGVNVGPFLPPDPVNKKPKRVVPVYNFLPVVPEVPNIVGGLAPAPNPLNEYRLYTYNFTLATVKDSALKNRVPTDYEFSASDLFIIAKSGGKGTESKFISDPIGDFNFVDPGDLVDTPPTPPASQLNISQDQAFNQVRAQIDAIASNRVSQDQAFNQVRQGIDAIAAAGRKEQRKRAAEEDYKRKVDADKIIKSFNNESPGRFDFYLNNVSIDTIEGGSEKTNMSHATSIEFDVFESYSMTGFIEAIHVASLAAGYRSYLNAPFLLKIEFWGYKNDSILSDPIKIPNATREFLFKFVSLDVDVDQEGTRYRCKGVPFNEYAFGIYNKLQKDTPIQGNTIGEVLENLMSNVTEQLRIAANNSNAYDSYSVVFPKISETGIDTEYIKNQNYDRNWIYEIPFFNQSTETVSTNIDVANIGDIATSISRSVIDSAESPIIQPEQNQFPGNTPISDCVQSVLRDSDFVKSIVYYINNPEESAQRIIDDYGFVNYFFVHIETEKKGIYDEARNRDCLNIRYVIIPYRMHFSRMFPRETLAIDTSKLRTIVHRKYNYFYTGKNLDLLKFDLKFNSLFYQAVPIAFANAETTPQGKVVVPETSKLDAKDNNAESIFGRPPIEFDAKLNSLETDNLRNAKQPDPSDPYDYLVRSLHSAVIQNVDQVQLEIEILGDPYYLCTMGMGNLKYNFNSDGTVGLQEAPVYFGDVHILIQFRNPKDRGKVLGFMEFGETSLYSGLFRIVSMNSQFKDGQFTQNLKLIRIPFQVEDTQTQGETNVKSAFNLSPNLNTQVKTCQNFEPSSIRASQDALWESIFSTPISGLPGDASILLPGSNSAAGSFAAGITVGTLANDVFSQVGATDGVGKLVSQVQSGIPLGLSNVGSALRLADSGLSSLGKSINSDGGMLNQVSNSLKTIGLSEVTTQKLADGIASVANGNVNDLSNQAISAVDSLGSKAGGLASKISANVGDINGKAGALASQLGLSLSALSGLGSDIQNKLVQKFSDVAKTIPDDVNLDLLAKRGVNINNIPAENLKKIPPTQPVAVAPPASPNLSDIKLILEKGGNLNNLIGAAAIPGIGAILASLNSKKTLTSNPLDIGAVTQKLNSVGQQLSNVTGNIPSVESGIGTIDSIISSQTPNKTPLPQSVLNVFGDKSQKDSPLKTAVINSIRGI